MVRNDDFDRRTVLRGAAGVIAAGALAGCSSGSGSSGGSSGDNGSGGGGSSGTSATDSESGGGGSTGTKTPTETGTQSTTGGGPGGASANLKQWLSGAKNYDGSIADMTGKDMVEIAVGAGNSGFAFDPAGVRISPGTTVRWTWTGKGGAHNVVAKGGAFDSGQIQAGSDVTYERTFDHAGTHPYYCEPHRHLGMKGAVVVGNA